MWPSIWARVSLRTANWTGGLWWNCLQSATRTIQLQSISDAETWTGFTRVCLQTAASTGGSSVNFRCRNLNWLHSILSSDSMVNWRILVSFRRQLELAATKVRHTANDDNTLPQLHDSKVLSQNLQVSRQVRLLQRKPESKRLTQHEKPAPQIFVFHAPEEKCHSMFMAWTIRHSMFIAWTICHSMFMAWTPRPQSLAATNSMGLFLLFFSPWISQTTPWRGTPQSRHPNIQTRCHCSGQRQRRFIDQSWEFPPENTKIRQSMSRVGYSSMVIRFKTIETDAYSCQKEYNYIVIYRWRQSIHLLKFFFNV